MIRRLISYILFLTCVLSVYAESDIHHQILVFRKSGDINMFYADKIAKIEMSKYDCDSIEHDEYVTQVFHRSDKSFIAIPIADIDSVAFGSRKSIVTKPNVRRLTDDEANAVTEFSETVLKYPTSTPASLIVKPGEVVYYDQMTERMPYGLCAKIKSVTSVSDAIVAEIEYLDPADVFDSYLITEDEESVDSPRNVSRAPGLFEIDLPRTEIGGISVRGNVGVRANAELLEGVSRVRDHYYHGIIRLHVGPHIEFAIASEDSNGIEKETDKPIKILQLPFLGGVISITCELKSFIKAMAEAGIEYEYNSGYIIETEWTRKDGHDTFGDPKIIISDLKEVEHKIEVHLKGEICLGPSVDVLIGVMFDRVGAGANFRVGPYLSGELSMGIIDNLSQNYTPENYAKGSIEMGVRLLINTFTYSRQNWLWGDRVHHDLPFKADLKFPGRTLELFPEFKTRATYGRSQNGFVQPANRPRAIDAATYTSTNIEYPLNTGFEITDTVSKKTISCIIEEESIVEANIDEQQNFTTEFVLVDTLADVKPENVVISPVFRYKGKIIKAAPCNIASDMVFSPIISALSKNNRYFVSGMTPVSQHDYEERTYIEGNLVPVTIKDNRFRPQLPAGKAYVNLEQTNPLIGTWNGNIDNKTVSLTFNDDFTGKYNDTEFKYSLNTPRVGGLSIKLSDGSSIRVYVISLSSTTLELMSMNHKQHYIFTK